MDFDCCSLHRVYTIDSPFIYLFFNINNIFLRSGQRPELIKVRIGSSAHSQGGLIVPVAEIVQHRNFSFQRIDYDYSLLRLNVTLNLDENKQAVRLPEQNETIADKTHCKVTGWGNTQNVSESRNVLREADVPIVNQVECANAYKNYGGVTARMICAGLREGGKDGKINTYPFRDCHAYISILYKSFTLFSSHQFHGIAKS